MSGAAEFLSEIGRAADDLGYGIESIDMNRVLLVPKRRGDIRIEIAGTFMPVTGDVLRRYLRDVREDEAKR